MMKKIGIYITVFAVMVCAAVLCAPAVQAMEPAHGNAQGQGGSPGGNGGRMQAPPSGGHPSGSDTGGQGTGQQDHGGSGQALNPAGTGNGPAGNPSQGEPAGIAMNATDSPAGPGGGKFSGTMTPPRQPAGEGWNATAPAGAPEGMPDFGNMTPPQNPPGGFGNATPGGAMPDFGNRTPPAPPSGGYTNSTPPAWPAQGQGSDMPAGISPVRQPVAQQQSADDAIADIISRLQALMAGKA